MNYIIYDLEATCWMGRPPKGVQEIIEIGAVKLNEYGDFMSKFNRFVKPVVNPMLSPFCKKLTSIKQGDVNRASTFPKVVQEFQDWIGVGDEEYMLSAWGELDIVFLRNDCALHKLEDEWLKYHIDCKTQYYKFMDLKTPASLVKALEMEGHEFEGQHHRAIADAENLVKVFRSQIDAWVY